MQQSILLRLYNEADGTFRITPDGYEVVAYDNGYQVGGYVRTLVAPQSTAILRDWLTRGHAELRGMAIPATGMSVGLWTDSQGFRHWDAGVRYTGETDYTLTRAMKKARENGEDYIWDWAAGKSLKVE